MKSLHPTSFIGTAALLSGLAALGIAQAQPVITSIDPDGTTQFQPAAKLSFVASATAGVSNISVQLTGTKMTGETFLKVYTSANGLTVTAGANGQNVSAPIKSNTLYSATIQVTDADGVATTSNLTFDTISPAYTFEAEDYDYDSGKFVDNPQLNGYRNLVAVDGVDAHNGAGGNQDYRPHDTTGGGLATESCGDKPRLQYKNSGQTDYDVGWNNNGNWANYTRHFPRGTYNVYIRGANPNGAGTDSAEVSGPVSGRFGVPNTGGWQTFTWVALKDIDGNLVEFTPDGTAQTLTISTMGGNYNANCYMLLPPITNPTTPPDATIDNPYPDGSYQYQATNKFIFGVSSTLGVNAADVTVQLAETNLQGKGSSKLLIAGGGLTVTGPATSLLISTPLNSNMVYTAFIQITDANGVPTTTNLVFDTLTPSYTWEAEDWDYGSGQFLDNPQTDGYSGLDGVESVDFARPSTGGGSAYGRVGLATESASDRPRHDHDGAADYDIGNNGTGNWVNYTRNWPAGKFNIFIRVANGTGTATPDAGSLFEVTSGVGTGTQTISKLGTYSSPPTGGWQKYNWQPLMDAGGNLLQFTGGSKKTLRHLVDGGNANQGFYLLMPADTNVHALPFVSNLRPDGTAIFQNTNVLSFTVNSSAGISTDNIEVVLDGVKASKLAFSGTANTLNVTCPVGLNAFHRVVITLSDSYGSTTNNAEFSTFDSAATYIFEAEDYDHSGGQFIDNPQVNGYQGLDATADVDTHTVAGNFDGTHVPYRPAGLNQENAADSQETAAHAGIQNYDLGNTAAGNWGNYTRTYPAGTYNIYVRAANGTGGASLGGSMDVVTSGRGTANQTTTNLGAFELVPSTGGWQSYTWAALRDRNGNLAQFTGGAVKTLRAICGGGQNMDYYALVPVDPSRPVLRNLYPDGSVMFQQTNTLSFVASSSAGIDTNSVTVTLNGVKVSNLVFTGSANSLTVSYPQLKPNTSYIATISFTSVNGGGFTTTLSFDTYSSAYYSWEAEDFDYTSNSVPGQCFENPQVNAYQGLDFTPGVDGFQADPGANPFSYRPNTLGLPPGTPTAGDGLRTQFVGKTDYRISWFGPGSWLNFTRHYPAGTYTVLGRLTEGASDSQVTLSRVTSGFGTTSQMTSPLGTFFVPLGGWNTWQYTPLTDAQSNLVTVTFDGSRSTLQLGGSPIQGQATINANFFMLIPATAPAPSLSATVSGGKVILSLPTVTGSTYQVQYKNNITDTGWSSLGSAIVGNGATQSVQDSLAAANRFYRVQILKQP
jgi:hypothetical protein